MSEEELTHEASPQHLETLKRRQVARMAAVLAVKMLPESRTALARGQS